jgi:putative tryptophan/tyrosine transport system substrate-binding protein
MLVAMPVLRLALRPAKKNNISKRCCAVQGRHGMRRPEFITLLASSRRGEPASTNRAHHRLHRRCRHADADARANTLAFEQAMHQLGWVQGRNLRINYFWGRGQPEAVRQHAADLAASRA